MNNKIKIGAGALVVLAVGYFTFSNPSNNEKDAIPKDGSFTAKPKYNAVASGLVDVVGGVTYISANLDGVISEVLVAEGDFVEKGQVLATQEDGAEQIALERAVMELDSVKIQQESTTLNVVSAEREVAELTPLYEVGAITKREFDQAQDRLSQNLINQRANEIRILTSNSALKDAEFRLDQKTIRSSVGGTIVKVDASPGLGASTTNITSLFTIIPDTNRIVRADVAVNDIENVSFGQKAEIFSFDDQAISYAAEVVNVGKLIDAGAAGGAQGASGQAANSNEQYIDVVLSLEETPFLIGQKVQVRFLIGDNSDGNE